MNQTTIYRRVWLRLALLLLLSFTALSFASASETDDLMRRAVEVGLQAKSICSLTKAYDDPVKVQALMDYYAGVLLRRQLPDFQSGKLDAKGFKSGLDRLSEMIEAIKRVHDPESLKVYIWPEGKMPSNTAYTEDTAGRYWDRPGFRPYLVPYLLDAAARPRGVVIISSGGGYFVRADASEGDPYARYFNSIGYQAFVLHYRVAPYTQMESALDLQRAIRFVRYHAVSYNIDPNAIAIIGSSAGGCVGMDVANQFYGDVQADTVVKNYLPDEVDKVSSDISAMMGIYTGFSPERKDRNIINPAFPPSFFVLGDRDALLKTNSMDTVKLLMDKNVPMEMHVFDGAPHGFGLGVNYSPGPEYGKPLKGADKWPELARIWLERRLAVPAARAVREINSPKAAGPIAVKVTSVEADCYVANFGQTVTSFDITVNDADAVKGLTPENFTIRNAVVDFEYHLLKESGVTSVSIDGNRIRLEVDEFLLYRSSGAGPLKGKPLTIQCAGERAAFTFSFSEIKAKTGLIDSFAFDTFEGMEYYLYTPKETSKPQPLMVYLHGNAMAGIQLLFTRTTSNFAAPEVQAKQQTYVFAPTSMLNKEGEMGWTSGELDTVVKFIRRLIAEGKVDPKRVYIQGNSMGGMGTIRAILAYPDLFAAAMPMCGTVRNLGDNRSIFEAEAKNILHLPLWILHAKNDTIVKFEDTKYVYDYLLKLGADRLKATWVEDDELQHYGIYFAHAADILSTYMPEVADWFFAQHK